MQGLIFIKVLVILFLINFIKQGHERGWTMAEQAQQRKQQTAKYQKKQNQTQQEKQQEQNLQEKTENKLLINKLAMQKYVVTWKSTANQDLGCKTPDFRYSRIPHSKYDGKYRLEAVVESISPKNLEETIKLYFPDCEQLKYKLYKPGKHIEICQRLAIAIDYSPGNA